MVKKIFFSLVLSLLWTSYLYAFAVQNADGVTIYYRSLSGTNASVVSGSSLYTGKVVIPETVTYLETTYSVTAIGSYAFDECTDLTEVIMPNSITEIGSYAFQYCSGLTEINIPNSVRTIGNYTFYGCTGLTEIIIPSSVFYIYYNAFGGCNNMTAIYVDANNSEFSSEAGVLFNKNKTALIFYPRGKSGEYTIPDLVTSIKEDAFSVCNGLTKITIPSSVISIGDWTFFRCSNLTEINSKNPTPPQIYGNTFEGVDKENCTLYVSLGCKIAYSEATGWSNFIDIKEKDFSTAITNVPSNINISVYKTNEGIRIIGCNSYDKVYIYSINGQMIYNSTVQDGLIRSSFEDGIYIVSLENNKATVNKKIVIR